MVTGAGRGQGRSHAVALAAEGADVVVCDIAADIDTVPYPLATTEDLNETVRSVQGLGRRCIGVGADVRDREAMTEVADAALSEFGRLDILSANAGIAGVHRIADMSAASWRNMLAVNLDGVFNSMQAVLPAMTAQTYGRIIATSSVVGRTGAPNIGHYVAAKWGVIGLVKSLALEVAEMGITVNAVCPTSVDTPMIQNEAFERLFLPNIDHPTRDQVEEAYRALNPMPTPWLDPSDVSAGVVFLASDEARYITGETLMIACGWNARNSV
jgi:SDR family mycofactocin-dependent oxidoreductase